MSIIQDFHSFYQTFYGDRWPIIVAALNAPLKQVARWNRFLGLEADHNGTLSSLHLSQLSGCYDADPNQRIELSNRQNDLLKFYIMDPASVVAARGLPVKHGDKILDLCAAPGGKTLILAEMLDGTGELICNELSMDRRARLKKVLQQYIPAQKRVQTWIKGLDGLKYGIKFPEQFDSILLDAPCSGEAHLLEDEKVFQKWTSHWTKKNAARQYGLLSSAYLAVRRGGSIMYSTCSLSPIENEQVIEKILHRRKDLSVVDKLENKELESYVYKFGEARKFGTIFLPDRCGFGPFYFCLLRKET